MDGWRTEDRLSMSVVRRPEWTRAASDRATTYARSRSESFSDLVADLRSAGLSPWRLRSLQEPTTGANEFRAILERG